MKRSAKLKLQMLFRVTANGTLWPCTPRDAAGQVRVPDGKQILSVRQAVRQPNLIPRRWLIEALRLLYAHVYADIFDGFDAEKESKP